MKTWSPSFKVLRAAFLVLLVFGIQLLQSDGKTARNLNIGTIQNILETKCRNRSQSQTYTYIKNNLKTASGCLTQKISLDNPKDAFCTESRLGLHTCYGKILGNVELCMEHAEKYLPKFIFDMLDVTLDNVCLRKHNATEFTRDVRLFQATLNTLVHQDLLSSCVSKFRVFWEIGQPVPLLEKTAMCEGLEKLGQCLVSGAKQKGDGYQSIADFVNAVFYKYLKLCENHLPMND